MLNSQIRQEGRDVFSIATGFIYNAANCSAGAYNQEPTTADKLPGNEFEGFTLFPILSSSGSAPDLGATNDQAPNLDSSPSPDFINEFVLLDIEEKNSKTLSSSSLIAFEDIKNIPIEFNLSTRIKLSNGIESERIIYNEDFKKTPVQTIFNAKEVYFGDAHGNILRVLYDLISVGAISPFTQTTWDKLKTIISVAKNIDGANFINFKKLVKKHVQINRNSPKIIFLGDLLADRQGHDALMLAFFYVLAKKGLNYKIILSNHDLMFFQYYYLNGEILAHVENEESIHSLVNYNDFLSKIGTPDEQGKKNLNKFKINLEKYLENYIENLSLFDYNDEMKLFAIHATAGQMELKILFVWLYIIESVMRSNSVGNFSYLSFEKINDLYEKFYIMIGDMFDKKKAEGSSNLLNFMSNIFNKIKKNPLVFSLFIQTPGLIKFCNHRGGDNHYYGGIPPLLEQNLTVFQGHDLNTELFLQDFEGITPPIYCKDMNKVEKYKRYSFDQSVGKNSLTQTHEKGNPLLAFVGIIPASEEILNS